MDAATSDASLMLHRKENVSLTAYCLGLLEKDVEQLKGVQAAGALLPMASTTPLPLCEAMSKGTLSSMLGAEHLAHTSTSVIQVSCSFTALLLHAAKQASLERFVHQWALQELCRHQIRCAGA